MVGSPIPFVAIALSVLNPIIGAIGLWYGNVLSVPVGWALCDGSHGTPDLTDKFIVGAGLSFAVGVNQGPTPHTHDFQGDGHTHTNTLWDRIKAGTYKQEKPDSERVQGITVGEYCYPPLHALCYIMRVS